MTLDGIGLVSRVPSVALGQLTRVAASIAQQVTLHVGPAWGLGPMVVQAYPALGDVPSTFGVLMVMADIEDGYYGYHKTSDGRPVAYIRPGTTWSLFASHEAIEMAIDPQGSEFRTGPSPVAGQGVVNFLLEACDPVQEFAYAVGGQMVSDFCLPAYYSSTAAAGTPLSYMNKLATPFSVGRNGYVTWQFQNDFWQLDRFGVEPRTRNLGPQNPVAGSYRAAVDRIHPDAIRLSRRGRSPEVRPIAAEARRMRKSNASYATRFRREVDQSHKARRRTR